MKKLTRRGFAGLAAGTAGMTLAAKGLQAATTKTHGDLPVLAETDVLVVGGGPAGIAAATAAAREGVDTMIIERYGFFGGTITQAINGSITWYRYAETIEAGGITMELEERAREMGGTHDYLGLLDGTPLKPFMNYVLDKQGMMKDGHMLFERLRSELFKMLADNLLLDAGVVPLLHCYVVDSLMDGDRIKGVITESKSGRQVVLAKRVIDASGDADVAARAGAPFNKAPKNELMEVTTNFSCKNVDVYRLGIHLMGKNQRLSDWVQEDCGKEKQMRSMHLFEPFETAKAADELPEDVEIAAYLSGFTKNGDVLTMNAVHQFGVDCTDVWDLTKAEIEGRKQVMMAMDVLRKYTPGFEKAEVNFIGASLGCRESRKIVGEYSITEHDVKNQARFEDSIGIFPEFLDAYFIVCLPTTGRYFQVPYRITLPQKVENLLVAGRSVSGDRVSYGATRQMGHCIVTGQGAGVAAAVSIKDGRTCREVDIKKVQNRLRKQDVRIA